VGGGLTGCEIAYDLAKDGKQVTIIEVLDDILKVKGLCAANANILRELLAYYNVEVLVNTSLSAVTEGSVTVKTADGLKNIEADTVITAVGYNSDNRLYEQIKDCGVPVHLIGDAKQVSNLMGAIWDAYEVAMTI
jgi:Pyridine nucleotide-disulphide oxidoreductase.